jgi:hypothetical protein
MTGWQLSPEALAAIAAVEGNVARAKILAPLMLVD